VLLRSQAHVVGDIRHQSLAIEKGAYFDGHSTRVKSNGQHISREPNQRPKRIPSGSEREPERPEAVA
jgi:cytoskeletal protein CcmA (bactofilin family)